jgi:hypothetical protein
MARSDPLWFASPGTRQVRARPELGAGGVAFAGSFSPALADRLTRACIPPLRPVLLSGPFTTGNYSLVEHTGGSNGAGMRFEPESIDPASASRWRPFEHCQATGRD